ncbi:MAG: UvrD-helicase domain-containing protein [Salinivenus sp.]
MTDSSSYDDAAARRRIGPWSADGLPDLSAFEPDTNFFVRAAAGSGKTTALVARMVALVRGAGVPVEDLAAITFTRKAAGEMNARFFKELRRAREAVPASSPQAERLDTALANAQRTFIGTIHSFCARLLRERPLAAGLPPDFAAGLEDREEEQLRRRAWQAHLHAVRTDAPERIEAITALGLEPDDLAAYFQTLCTHPELTPYTHAPDRLPDLQAAVQAVRARLDEWQALRPEPLPKGRDNTMRAFDKAEQMLRYQDLETPAQRAAFLELFDDLVRDGSVPNRDCKVTYWGEAKAEAKTLRDEALPELVATTIRPVLRQWQAHVHAQVVSFVRPAVDTYREQRREQGKLTFHDLLLHTRDLLRDHPEARRRFAEQYGRLLVDEFQDTDPLQAEILFYLTSQDPTETDWRACRPRPGSLFIVGDDKQSIYRFRRADKDVFDDVGTLIEAAGGERIDLTKNFRSVGRICDWCDRAFGRLFSEADHADLQADYVPFDPQRPDGREGTALRRLAVDKVSGNWGRDIAEANAKQIANVIREAIDGALDDAFYGPDDEDAAVFPGGASYDDFLILTRNKTRLSIYAETLAAYDIPYTVTGSEDLGDAAELKALVDLLTCALRPDDAVAVVAYLKGALVGCSDDDLYRFRRAGGRFDETHAPVPSSVTEALDASVRDRICSALKRLREARTWLRETRPSVAVERIVETFGLLAGAAHPPDAAEASLRAGAVLRILTVVESLSAQGLDWAEVTEELQRVLDGDTTIDGLTLETGEGEAVRLMNVHQAKGLQAPVVFLADPYSRGGGTHTITRHVRRETDELVAPVVQGEGHYQRVTHPPLGWHEERDPGFEALEARHERAEEHRLLYVAATRAANLLVVSTYPEKPDDGPWAPLYPHLEAAGAAPLTPSIEPPQRDRAARAPDLEAAEDEREHRLHEAGRPSYQTRSVTETEDDTLPSSEDLTGYGTAVGRAVHRLLEQCVRRRAEGASVSASEARQALRAGGAEAPAEQVPLVLRLVRSVLSSVLWDEVAAAPVAYAEYPLAEVQAGDPPVVRLGQIDLMYRRETGWGLVDFKTDRLAGPPVDAVPPRHPYRRQVRAYAALWRRQTGEPVTRAGLWFADAEQFVSVDPDADR